MQEAIDCYSEALLLNPDDQKEDRGVFFANRAACYLKLVFVGLLMVLFCLI